MRHLKVTLIIDLDYDENEEGICPEFIGNIDDGLIKKRILENLLRDKNCVDFTGAELNVSSAVVSLKKDQL